MEYLRYPDNFFELADPQSNYKFSKAVIIPVPYEQTTTGMQGTKLGPLFMKNASVCVQPYDEELDANSCEIGICTLPFLDSKATEQKIMDSVYSTAKQTLNDGKFPILIGGEHSISSAAVKACSEHTSNISVLHIDAHTDLADMYGGTKHSHACAARRCFEAAKDMVQVGIRSTTLEEKEFAKQSNIAIFWAKDIFNHNLWIHEALKMLGQHVYITIDLDGFDPSAIPAVGNPEPGGLSYYSVLELLKRTFKEKKVIGMDIVELCPRENDASFVSDYTAAKLLYKCIGYKFFNKK